MLLSRERLLKEKKNTGYRQEIIEKVVWLMEMLNAIAEDSFLSSRLALKGGTALNLFYFDLPRLSVDADLNYVGAIDRDAMLKERPEIEKRITGLFERMGLQLTRNPNKHAGGKMVWRYPSSLGNQGNVEVDLNYMYRVPLLPTEYKSSITLAGKQVNNLQVLDIHELAAGKLTALLERQTGRDFFDASELFRCQLLKPDVLRIIFVAYAAMCSKKNMLTITLDDVAVDQVDMRNKLIPVMKDNFSKNFSSIDKWTQDLMKQIRGGFDMLLPFTAAEEAFIHTVVSGNGIKPELITSDVGLANLIKSHPALLWAGKKKA